MGSTCTMDLASSMAVVLVGGLSCLKVHVLCPYMSAVENTKRCCMTSHAAKWEMTTICNFHTILWNWRQLFNSLKIFMISESNSNSVSGELFSSEDLTGLYSEHVVTLLFSRNASYWPSDNLILADTLNLVCYFLGFWRPMVPLLHPFHSAFFLHHSHQVNTGALLCHFSLFFVHYLFIFLNESVLKCN